MAATTKWKTEPSFWYEGVKSSIGPNTIKIHYKAEAELGDNDSDFKYEWKFKTLNSADGEIQVIDRTVKSEKSSDTVTL